MEEAEAKEQLLELSGPLASAKEGWIVHRVSQVAAEQVLPARKAIHTPQLSSWLALTRICANCNQLNYSRGAYTGQTKCHLARTAALCYLRPLGGSLVILMLPCSTEAGKSKLG